MGTNQVRKAVTKGLAKEVFIAENTDRFLKESLVDLCEKHKVEIKYLDSKKELGKLFGIGINAATAAILI